MILGFSEKKLLTLCVIFSLVACANREPQAETLSICDESGCADRPEGYTSFDPEKSSPAEDPGGKIAALEQLAARDPRAAYDLALRFFRGDGVRQDSYKSIKWMRDAAERGDFNAQKALGRLYLTGLGETGSDPGEAQKWLSIAASKGDKESAQLLQQATAAHQSQQAEYRWNTRWRSVFYNNWFYGYPYQAYWGANNWSFRY
ncbi:MAG: sel1 repeat family protein [Methylococcaceae bacterium]|nr:sel1 repeat family protein [Methylococcaceae bacterium]